MERLRKAIIHVVNENDMDTVGEVSDGSRELINAFNEAGPFPGHPEVEPIIDADLNHY